MQKYIKFAKPAIVILENVTTFAGPANRKPFLDLIQFLESCGYSTQHKVLCTSDFGIPQNRRRVYIVAIQKRLVRLPFAWPKPIGHIPLSKMWDRDRRGIIVKSTKIPEDVIAGKTTFDNLQSTFKKLKKMKLVPSQTDCILDLGASSRFATFKINMAPTLTASRCASQMYYSTKQMRKLSLSELMRLQGCDPKRFNTSGLTKTQLGSIIGNAMSVNVMEAVIEKAIKTIGGISKL